MTGRRGSHRDHQDSDDWVSGAEPMSDQQEAFLERLCEEAAERMDYALTKAQASRRINELKEAQERRRLQARLARAR